MSGSQFLRLYREIDRSLPSKKTTDHFYEKERYEALQKLPEFRELFKTTAPVKRPKYHGKLIRQFNNGLDNDRRRDLERKEKERRQKQEISEVMRQSQDIREIIHSMHDVAEKRSKIPILVLRKMDLMDEREGKESSPDKRQKFKTTSSSPNLLERDPRINPRRKTAFGLPTHDFDAVSVSTRLLPRLETKTSVLAPRSENFRHVTIYDRSYSKARWSAEERKKLHLLYQEILLPPKRCHVEIWRAYFRELCQRFQCFFPERSAEEIVEKARLMVAKAQMKEKGEEDFWRFLFEEKFHVRENIILTPGKDIISK